MLEVLAIGPPPVLICLFVLKSLCWFSLHYASGWPDVKRPRQLCLPRALCNPDEIRVDQISSLPLMHLETPAAERTDGIAVDRRARLIVIHDRTGRAVPDSNTNRVRRPVTPHDRERVSTRTVQRADPLHPYGVL